MSIDPSVQRAIEIGQRNVDGFPLVKNWCAHVRINRHGGVGMVEEATKLPIGMHGLACDHAPAGGIMCWDIRDAALYFYDRYCRNCALRKPVGIPNLGNWVAERDAKVARQREAEDAEARELAAGLIKRRSERTALRAGLLPVEADVVNQIDELDLSRAPQLKTQLVETARLAPEAFPPAVTEYAFSLLEAQEAWFEEAGLRLLAVLNVNPPRLVRCAMICLKNQRATRTAASVLVSRLHVVDQSLIPAAMPAVILLASPAPTRWPFEVSPRPRIATLVRLNSAFPHAVAAAIDSLLDGGPKDVGLAACAVGVLAQRDPALVARFARDLISKLARSKWLPDPHYPGHDENEVVARNLLYAIQIAFLSQPDVIDALLEEYRVGASEAGEIRILSVYDRVLHSSRFSGARPATAADRIAFKRLIWTAPTTTSHKALNEIHHAVRGMGRDLMDLARDNVDGLLGAAVLMDTRVVAFDAGPKPTSATLLDSIERRQRRSSLTDVRNSFVHLAAVGACASSQPSSYLQFLEGLPEDRDEFAACMIENSVALMDTVAGLNAVLPSLYSALVGMSVARRGSAVRAVGEIPRRQRENAPDLLFEAFVTTLTDPYVYVHSSAVTALDRISLPSGYNARVRKGLWAVLLAHEKDPYGEDIVLKCIELLARRYLTDDERAGRVGAFLVTLLRKIASWRVSNEIGLLARQLAHAEGLVDFLIAHLLDTEATEYQQDAALEALADLPIEVVYSHRETLAKIPVGEDRSARYRVIDIAEILARSRAWAEAERLSKAAVEAIPDTIRESSQRLVFQLVQIAAAFEHALAIGDHEHAAGFVKRWREVNATKEANDRERAELPNPFRDLPNPA